MPVWFTIRGRRACKPAALGQPGAAEFLPVAVLGLSLLVVQCRPVENSDEASADAISRAQVSASSSETATMDSQGCLPDGSGSVTVKLSGAVDYDIEWDNESMECGGFNGVVQIGGVAAGAGSYVDLMFDIEVEEGATGTGLPARVAINDRATEAHFQTSEAGGCTATVTEQSLIDENPAMRTYKIAANGSCTVTSLQYSGPGGAGAAEITVGDFEIIGIAVWM